MAKTPNKQKPENIELEPDAWDRFKRQMDKIVPPKKPKRLKEKTRGKSGDGTP